jgi:uncharacterized membrane protein YjjP (DUF1212 family)
MKVFEKFNLGILSCIIAGIVIVSDSFYLHSYDSPENLFTVIKLVLFNLFGVLLGSIGLLKIKITHTGNKTYYIIGCISNIILIIGRPLVTLLYAALYLQ